MTMSQAEESESERRGLLPASAPVKIMEKACHVFVVDNFPRRRGIGIGKSVESSPFTVGGFSFSIQLYPDGVNEEAHRCGYISLFIKNETTNTAQIVYALEILDRTDVDLPYGHSSFDVTQTYHQVDAFLPASVLGYFDYITHSSIHKYYGAPNHSLLIRATVGVVLDHDHVHQQLSPTAKSSSSPPIERHRCIVFQVGDLRFFEKESVIIRECPALVSDYTQSDHTILISDVQVDVFKAVLFFLNNKYTDQGDRPALANINGVFALKMLAAAHKLHLKSLTSYNIYGNLHVLYRYCEIGHSVKKLWRKLSSSWLPPKMKEA